MDGLDFIDINFKKYARWKHLFGRNPEYANHLIIWGEEGTVNIKTDRTPKVEDQGLQCMMVVFVLNNNGDCYRMWNPNTNYIYESRDILWLQIMYYPKQNVTS